MKFMVTLLAWVALLMALIFFVAEGVRVAVAHSWYPALCCTGKDCKSLPAGAVSITSGGYEFDLRGRHYIVPFSEANTTPEQHMGESGYHVCIIPEGSYVNEYANTIRKLGSPTEFQNRSTLCFWAPDPGS